MEISQEQLLKIFELAGLKTDSDFTTESSTDITRALVEIERKLNFFDTNINFDSDRDRVNVLVVDDLELSIYQLTQLLKKIGITPSVARSKEEALGELRKKTFNFALIDLFLPDSQDGYDLINEAIKLKESIQKGLNIIIMSGTDDKNVIDKCYELGADGYIAKSEMWHTEVLKYINSSMKRHSSNEFSKHSENQTTMTYHVSKFNSKKIFDEVLVDINSALLAGYKNILLNLEQLNSFDADNAFIFADIYKVCAANGGVFALINPPDKIKDALSFAYLDGIIPLFYSTLSALEYIKAKNNSKNI